MYTEKGSGLQDCAATNSGPANAYQVGGAHYRASVQHWDYVIANEIPYLEAQIIKYLTRWRKKGGHQDLRKAQHFFKKLFETEGLDWATGHLLDDIAKAAEAWKRTHGPDREPTTNIAGGQEAGFGQTGAGVYPTPPGPIRY